MDLQIAHRLFQSLTWHLPDEASVFVQYATRLREFPRLRRPYSFNERLNHRKLFDRDPRMVALTDKLTAKAVAADVLGPEWIIPTLWFGTELPPRDERKWEIPLILKPTHGSGWVHVVAREDDLDWGVIEEKAAAWMRTTYGLASREWHYKSIPKALLIEPFLGRFGELPVDYKFFVFGGRVEYVQVHTDRARGHKNVFFDRDWRRQSFGLAWPIDDREIRAPRALVRMIDAAERLSRDFAFVRVDLYEIEDAPLFGEFTFTPEAGLGPFSPRSYDRVLGSLWPPLVSS